MSFQSFRWFLGLLIRLKKIKKDSRRRRHRRGPNFLHHWLSSQCIHFFSTHSSSSIQRRVVSSISTSRVVILSQWQHLKNQCCNYGVRCPSLVVFHQKPMLQQWCLGPIPFSVSPCLTIIRFRCCKNTNTMKLQWRPSLQSAQHSSIRSLTLTLTINVLVVIHIICFFVCCSS